MNDQHDNEITDREILARVEGYVDKAERVADEIMEKVMAGALYGTGMDYTWKAMIAGGKAVYVSEVADIRHEIIHVLESRVASWDLP